VEILSIARPDSVTAEVRTRISFLGQFGSGAELTLQHRWAARQDAWYFVPVVQPAPKRYYRR
jgi:hypothetical protein